MTPEEHVEQAVLQYPALEEVLQVRDATIRAAALHAIALAIETNINLRTMKAFREDLDNPTHLQAPGRRRRRLLAWSAL